MIPHADLVPGAYYWARFGDSSDLDIVRVVEDDPGFVEGIGEEDLWNALLFTFIARIEEPKC
jgi:hypothetical protein